MTKLALSAVLLLSPSLPGLAYAEEPSAVRVAFLDDDFYRIIMDYAEPFFGVEGIKVEKLPVLKGTTGLVVSGRADIGISGVAPVMNAYQNGADLKVIASLFPRFDYVALSRYGPGDGGKIKRMALNNSGGEAYLVILPFLQYLKADPAKIETILAAGDAPKYALLEQGGADIVVMNSRELAEKARKGGKYTVIPFKKVSQNIESRIQLTALDKVIGEKGAVLEKFLAALYASLKSASSDKAKMTAFLKEKYSYSAEDAEALQADLAAGFKGMDFAPDAAYLQSVSALLPEEPAPGGKKNKEPQKPKAKRALSGLAAPAYAIKARARVK